MARRKQLPIVPRRDRVTVALSLEANRWIREEAEARGWRLLNLDYCGFQVPEELVPAGALVDKLPDDPLVLDLQRAGCPVVRLGRLPHPKDADLPAVLPVQFIEGRIAAEHFAERGFRDVGFFGRSPWGDAERLFLGFEARARELDLDVHLYRSSMSGYEPADSRERRRSVEFAEWIQAVPKPFGLFAQGEFFAARYCARALQLGIRVPEDLAVLSRGNLPSVCESNMPTLSALDRNDEGRSRTACALLAKLMSGEDAPSDPVHVPPTGVIERESSSVLAVSDPLVAAALRYMWDHLDLDLSLDDVAAQVGLSRRHLSRRFRAALGRSFVDELRRKRLAEAKVRLRSTELSIAELAPLLGFRSTSYFHRAFRAAFDLSPSEYRRMRRVG